MKVDNYTAWRGFRIGLIEGISKPICRKEISEKYDIKQQEIFGE